MEELLRGHFYHMYIKKIPGRIVFAKPSDFFAFIHHASLLKRQHNLDLVAYCLLPTHYHLIIGCDLWEAPGTIKGSGKMHPLSNFIQQLHYSYNQFYREEYGTKKNIITQEPQAFLIDKMDDLKLFTCYLHFHPEREGLVKDAKEWKYSSLQTFLDDFTTDEDQLLDRHFFPGAEEYENFFKDYLFNKDEKDKMIEYLIPR